MARRKPKGRKKEQNDEFSSDDLATLPDRRSIEKVMADVTKLLAEQQFETPQEMEAFLQELMASGPIPAVEPETPLERAQEVMYEAWESSGKKRVRLARKALKISPDCADAYVLLGEEEARSLEDARVLFEKGVQAGERAIGEELFITGEGGFWGILETRPYMRARAGLAHCLWQLGEKGEAIGHLQEMLRLNPGDNQGQRYILNIWFLTEGRDAEAAELLKQYDGEVGANWAYTEALLSFRMEGDTAKARRYLKDAVLQNPYVPAFLLGSRPFPEHYPDYIGIGDENEAVDYAAAALPVWRETPGALAWLVMNRGERKVDWPAAELEGDMAPEVPFEDGDPVAMKANQRLQSLDLDITGWQGWVEEIDGDGDLWVRWDSQSLEAIPDQAIKEWHEDEIDWTVLIVEPDAVEAAQPRDDPGDWLAVVTKRYKTLGLDINELVVSSLAGWIDDFDDLDLEESNFFGAPDYPSFDPDHFLADQEFPKNEHNAILRGLSAGLGKFYYDIYGYYKYGERPLLLERMQEPFIFGYGAVEVLKEKSISSASKLKFLPYALEVMQPGLEQGVPYGLVSMLGYAASEGDLSIEEFMMAMLALEFDMARPFFRPDWMEAVTKDRLITLAEWLGSHEEMPDGQKLWWIWQLGIHCEGKAHLGKSLLEYWLDRPDVTAEAKAELCWGWLLDGQEVGQAPLLWLLTEAYLAGDQRQFQQLVEEAGIDPETLPLPFADEPPAKETLGFPYDALSDMRHFVLIPPFLKRGAIPGLVRYGDEGLEEIADMFWDSERDYYVDALNSGIADALEEFHESVSPERMRYWIERGINYGRAQTRKSFYMLSTRFYGTEYLEGAVNDNAKSIRTWAGKKLRALQGG
jgi:tetratricopeptide (TPR) repeat protein